MNRKAHDPGRKIHFDLCNQEPALRHPYEKYNPRLSKENFVRIPSSNRDFAVSSSSSRFRKRKDINTDFLEICDALFEEEPGINSFYPEESPRTTHCEGTSARESFISKSFDNDFDSKTYRVLNSESSNYGDKASPKKSNLKKGDDIHHFHEHHHFFHETAEESPNSSHRGKSKEPSKLLEKNPSLLKKSIEESCIFYQNDGGGEGRKCGDGPKGAPRSSSKNGKKSTDNERKTVVCEHCQKLLRDYPDAKVVGHESVPLKLSSEVGDRKHGSNGESMRKGNRKSASNSVADQVSTPRQKKKDKNSKVSNYGGESNPSSRSHSARTRSSSREKCDRDDGRTKRGTDNSNEAFFECDHCKTIIQFPYFTNVLKNNRSKCSCNSDEVVKRAPAKQSGTTGRNGAKSGPTSAGEKKSNDRKSVIRKKSESSIDNETRRLYSGKSAATNERAKGFGAKPTKTSANGKGDSIEKTYRVGRVEIQEGKIRNLGQSETVTADKKSSSGKERKASGKSSKKAATTIGSIDGSDWSKESSVYGDVKSSRKTSLSGYKLSKDANKKQCSGCGESKNIGNANEEGEKSARDIRKRMSSYRDSSKSADKKTSTNRKDLGVSSRKVGTELSTAQMEAKQKVTVVKERSMQTEWEKMAADNVKAVKRSRTASKTVAWFDVLNGKRCGTAPASSRATKSSKESSAGSTISKKTIASNEVPIVKFNPKGTSGLSGIQNEIFDLRTQLYRLEAMQNLKSNGVDEENNDGKHPIVVCTSTTYIMTNYGLGGEGKHGKEVQNPKESSRRGKKDPAVEYGMHVESSPPRPKDVHVGKSKNSRGENARGKYSDTPKKADYQQLDDGYGKNCGCHCSSRKLVSKFKDGMKSSDTDDKYRRFFGNGKNQEKCFSSFRGPNGCHMEEGL